LMQVCLVDWDSWEVFCTLKQSSLNILYTEYLWMLSKKFHSFPSNVA
jgi:hypothetical protein